ncbi:MAG TPA: putative toxin-antitoxin system toxin component, PIN family [Deltaproteobacteria bacterium]|nr:putative toxin-antitoxin system toxin component, PIN family [Deltaproteobacteria bacterium]
MEKIKAFPLKEKICRDPDDDWILSTALEGEANCIITGDRDLLTLSKYQEIFILKPEEFWKFESTSSSTISQ